MQRANIARNSIVVAAIAATLVVEKKIASHLLSVPDISRECRCFKQALSDLWPKKRKITKISEFPSGRLGSFSGGGLSKHTNSTPREFAFSQTKIGQYFEFSEFASLGCWSLECRDLSGPLKPFAMRDLGALHSHPQ